MDARANLQQHLLPIHQSDESTTAVPEPERLAVPPLALTRFKLTLRAPRLGHVIPL